ncbi:hypothetical protein LZ32DRAFT_47384 [Colletotrichum eremochloae]|nr:hypothetical protein LZ32DRAFT_47384 [Colletotrichum eremochloae]
MSPHSTIFSFFFYSAWISSLHLGHSAIIIHLSRGPGWWILDYNVGILIPRSMCCHVAEPAGCGGKIGYLNEPTQRKLVVFSKPHCAGHLVTYFGVHSLTAKDAQSGDSY